ncbi:tRNA lysidine(34) synthetase TilS [Pseudooceanicola aestuarii]|uniref:tRNA lysidine(34) synthetase TilS n=1 Tax=Pseudooceanicola aestuarii TaxID=2697319 RepID=UPI0013D5022D|nr:tRNA lysidine(34) synthetase TilS [Pseudooceanicola aestuarii]
MTADAAGTAGATALRRHFTDPLPRLGVAVSGGSDSLALLCLLRDHATADAPGMALHVATVDHNLRPEARQEAAQVARLCARWGLPHTVLTWTGWNGQGNLQDAARRARLRLLADWARGQGIADVALAHSATDQAETLLMRLARSAGVDGLAAMAPRRVAHGVTFHRPLLGLTREALREILTARAIPWADDPSNDDPRFHRIRLRQARAQLDALGLTVPALAATAAQLGEARAALDAATSAAARRLVTADRGILRIDAVGVGRETAEIARRLLARALRWINGADYPPRRAALADALAVLHRGGTHTLAGCVLMSDGTQAQLMRELNAVAGARTPLGGLWDGRWRLEGPPAPGAEIRALGAAGLTQCPDWRVAGLPRAAQMVGPALWAGDRLLCAPLAETAPRWSARLIRDEMTGDAASMAD